MIDFLDVITMLSQCEDKEERRQIVRDWRGRELTTDELAEIVSNAQPIGS